MHTLIKVLCVVTVFGWTGVVNAGLITFEEFGLQPSTFDGQEPLDSEYDASLGVNFSGGWEILNQGGNFGLNARSGSHFAAFNTAITGITNTLTILFDSAITQASGFVGLGSQGNWSVSAFLDASQVASQNLVNPAGQYAEFSLSGAAFNRITVQSSAAAGVLDDLAFESSTQQVPAPATLALMGLGLAGLGWKRRKKA